MDPEDFTRLVGQNVKRARWLAGVTQEVAASEIGISYRYFREIEVGRRNPSIDVLFKIARTFDVTVADLVEVPDARPMRPPLFSRDAEPPPRGRGRR